ncbi:hypothetical protein GO495_29155 [Chitinophaga oryziterrae]|uniref:VCBS repeat-containing protein n=1 Tax=Chitinophaga oryziterrae TaxID=1031224 RepID=A0A6N8JHJ6_9BACT|nr:hypothetical protein [Chitinophaga oryziterrae]MVT44697.1 hypothetical protein [Chitinophaga oryziterrae]
MNKCLIVLVFFALSCNDPEERNRHQPTKVAVQAKADTGLMTMPAPPQLTEKIPDTLRIEGDFNGDHQVDVAYAVLYRGDKYIVRFSSDSIRPLPVSEGRIRLVNEHDLNNDGRDDLTIFQESRHRCSYNVSTWSYMRGRWRRITKTWVLPYFCDYISDEELQDRIVLEDGTLYYYEADVKDENFSLVKKEMYLR